MASAAPRAWASSRRWRSRRCARCSSELTPGEAPPGVACSPAPLHVLAGAVLEQHGLATAVTRLLPVMVPGNLSLRLDFDGYVPQVVRHEQALLRVCQEAVSNVIRHAAGGTRQGHRARRRAARAAARGRRRSRRRRGLITRLRPREHGTSPGRARRLAQARTARSAGHGARGHHPAARPRLDRLSRSRTRCAARA